MKELKCPNCGSVFQVDEADYAAIAAQVRGAEFENEVKRRVEAAKGELRARKEADDLRARNEFAEALNGRDLTISRLRAELERVKAEGDTNSLKAKAESEAEILKLRGEIERGEERVRIAVLEEQRRADSAVRDKEAEIQRLWGDIKIAKTENELREKSLREEHALELKKAQEMIEYYKDLKARMSTKMIGESLEQHCYNEFCQYRAQMYPNAYFSKDNDASGGSKGDFIFRDFIDGEEYISIMFEMKNEADTTATKHRNQDFFAKLDKDRREKNCEYAVLVSLLESDNELYNAGIVDVSYQYEKMFVIRPQFFLPVIGMLASASAKSLHYKRELAKALQQSVDVTGFEDKLSDFRDKFGRHYTMAQKKFRSAIEEIDKTIKCLTQMKANLLSSEDYLGKAEKDTEKLTIRRLTYGNPTMKAAFEEARRKSANPETDHS